MEHANDDEQWLLAYKPPLSSVQLIPSAERTGCSSKVLIREKKTPATYFLPSSVLIAFYKSVCGCLN